ncbi:hypothetical protein [Cyclobacterium roseum]|uniref:hypothetical protein n=1 Tax=Cyclobacterium roseum TaxID=2666137 RepID=UPI00139173A7|nr:hypothetical protein [Cyclobacterium roseum]
MNKILIVFLILVISCSQEKNKYHIRDDKPIILIGELGEIRLNLLKNSILLDKIEIYNNERELVLEQSFDDQGMFIIKSKESNIDSISYNTYKYFSSEVEKQKVNDSLTKEIYHNLITTREFKYNGDILYLDMIENGRKRYNALNLKLVDSEWISDDKVKLLLKNYFPFDGEFKFYYLNSKEKLISKRIEKNYYLVEFQKETGQQKSIKFDIEIVPSESDSLMNSIFTQEIFLEY